MLLCISTRFHGIRIKICLFVKTKTCLFEILTPNHLELLQRIIRTVVYWQPHMYFIYIMWRSQVKHDRICGCWKWYKKFQSIRSTIWKNTCARVFWLCERVPFPGACCKVVDIPSFCQNQSRYFYWGNDDKIFRNQSTQGVTTENSVVHLYKQTTLWDRFNGHTTNTEEKTALEHSTDPPSQKTHKIITTYVNTSIHTLLLKSDSEIEFRLY